MHGHGLADDEAIADELADGLAGVGVGDLVHLIGVEPNLALAAAHHGGGEALLGAKVDPVEQDTLKVSMGSKVSGVEFLGFDIKKKNISPLTHHFEGSLEKWEKKGTTSKDNNSPVERQYRDLEMELTS